MQDINSNSPSDWYAPLRAIQSLGSQDEGPGSLAGLHDARKRHLGQFFTPDHVARFMFDLASQAMPAAPDGEAPLRYSVIDIGCGSGRLLQFCDPDKHFVGGVDVHRPTIEHVQQVFEAAGFGCAFDCGSMEGARPAGWSVALINPPFSIHFESPLLKRYPSNSHGKHGPRLAARSDRYALHLALDAADVVVALLPNSIATWVESHEEDAEKVKSRWRATFTLPTGTFKSEGADVEVSILVFGLPRVGQGIRARVRDIAKVPLVDIAARPMQGEPRIRWKHLDDASPSITLPVTGDKSVRISHDGRRLRLKFSCGFTQARVMNSILEARNSTSLDTRLPKQYPYLGSAKLDLEAHIATGDALDSLQGLLKLIVDSDAVPVGHQAVMAHLRRRERRSQRQGEPMAHTVWDDIPGGSTTILARARKKVLADEKAWFGWVIDKGVEVAFAADEAGAYVARKGAWKCVRTLDEIRKDFEVICEPEAQGWRRVHQGLIKKWPTIADGLRAKAKALGIGDWLDWEFQQEDLIELAMKPRGAIGAWSMGLGKTRLAVALCLLSGSQRCLVAMDAYLVPEFAGKLDALPIPKDDWQVIGDSTDLQSLKRINLISYERLRMTLPGQHRLTYAHRLRRRIGTLIADEGELLANPNSQQSSALAQVSAKHRYVMTGTPLPNYPRDILPIMAFAAGDGTAAQPWGYRGPRLEARLVRSAHSAQRGMDAFREAFCTLEWCTSEFAEDNRTGAKREVPKITNLAAYRAALAPHLKRRVPQEPEVVKDVRIRDPIEESPRHVAFDEEHLGYYVKVADEFSRWWANRFEERSKGGRKVNPLMLLLVRIGAVVRANNAPQRIDAGTEFRWSGGLTSKQRFGIDRLQELLDSREKVILLCRNPETVSLFARELKKRKIDSIPFHGGIPIAKRYEAMDKGFRKGGTPLLLATYGVTQAGMDLPQATRVIYYERDWAYKVERQALSRALRPQTDHDVAAEWWHITGSIDEYMAQMVAFKRDCFRAGVDWCAPELHDKEFLHMDTIVGRFIEGLAKVRGVASHALRDQLKLLAA